MKLDIMFLMKKEVSYTALNSPFGLYPSIAHHGRASSMFTNEFCGALNYFFFIIYPMVIGRVYHQIVDSAVFNSS